MRPKTLYAFTIILALALSSCGAIAQAENASTDAVNIDDSSIAIQGFDPVAYFTLNTPTKGNSEYTGNYQGATYLFSSASHQKLFKDDPAKYAPQFGGYCAYGVSNEKKYPIDPEAFDIVDGKLYLNLNKKVQSIWTKNSDELITDAASHWKQIEDTPISEL